MTEYSSAKLSNGYVEIIKKELPKLTEDAVIIKLIASGICRADIKEVTDSRDIPEDRGPLFGHEINGVIVSAGNNTGFHKDTYVTFNPNVTRNRTTGFAEYMIVIDSKEILKQAIIPYNKELNSERTKLIEPFASVLHSINTFQNNAQFSSINNKKIAIIGAGNSGMSFGLLAKHRKAQIKILNINDGRLEFAEKLFPKEELIPLSDYHQYKEKFDVVIICSTIVIDEVLEIGFALARANGILHIYSGTRSGDKFLDSDVNIDKIRREESIKVLDYKDKLIKLSGSYGAEVDDFKKAFEDIDLFPLDQFISKEISLEEFPGIIMDMASGEMDYPGKVIIEY